MRVAGALLVLLSLAVPSAMWIETLREVPEELRLDLLNGALLFRLGLAGLGALLWFAPRMPSDSARPVVPPDRSISQREKLALAGLLGLSLVVRLVHLGDGLWLDEILMRVNYARPPLGQVLTDFTDQNQHLGYSVLANLSAKWFGESEFSIRLPAALYGVASIGALFWLLREIGPRREAWLSAALLAASYHHVWFSQNARGYTGVLFWTTLSSWLLLRGLAPEGARARTWWAFGTALALGVYTHLTMVFVAVAQLAIYAAVAWRGRGGVAGRWVPLVCGFGFATLLGFCLYAIGIPQFLSSALHESSTVSTWRNPLWTVIEILAAFGLSGPRSVIAIAAAAVFGVGVLSYGRDRPALVCLFFVPAILAAVISIALGHHLWPRTFFLVAGFAIAIAIRGGLRSVEWGGARLGLSPHTAARVASWGAGFVILGSAVSVPFAYGPKQDFAAARQLVESERRPGDSAVAVGLARFPLERLYAPTWQSAEDASELAARRARAGHTWVVTAFPLHMAEVHSDIVKILEADFERRASFRGSLNGGDVEVFRSRGETQDRAR